MVEIMVFEPGGKSTMGRVVASHVSCEDGLRGIGEPREGAPPAIVDIDGSPITFDAEGRELVGWTGRAPVSRARMLEGATTRLYASTPGEPCAACGALAEGNYSIHRDGFCEGPEVALCDACGGSEEPSLEDLWATIADRSNVCRRCEHGPRAIAEYEAT